MDNCPAQVLRAMALQEKIGRSTLNAAGQAAARPRFRGLRPPIGHRGIGAIADRGVRWRRARRSGPRTWTAIDGIEPLCSLTAQSWRASPTSKAESTLQTATGVASPDLARAPRSQSTINPLRENGAPERRSSFQHMTNTLDNMIKVEPLANEMQYVWVMHVYCFGLWRA
jgi:hypothetical protein